MYAIRRSLNFQKFVNRCKNQRKIEQSSKTFYTYSPEPGQPLNRDPTFCSVEEAVKCVKSGE